MSTDVQNWLKECRSCQQVKLGPGKGQIPLKQELSRFPMEKIALDIMGHDL